MRERRAKGGRETSRGREKGEEERRRERGRGEERQIDVYIFSPCSEPPCQHEGDSGP